MENTKKIFLISVLICSGFLLSGCSFLDRDVEISDTPVSIITQNEFFAEKFFPPGLDFVIALNTQDPGQQTVFESLQRRLYLEHGVAYEVLKPVVNRLLGYGIDFEKDFEPFMGRNFRTLWGEKDDDYYVAATISDKEAVAQFMDKLAGSGFFSDSAYENHRILGNAKDSIYVLLYDDVLLFTNTRDNAVAALDRYELSDSNIKNDPRFVEFEKEIETSDFAYFYKKVSDEDFYAFSLSLTSKGAYLDAYSSNGDAFKKASTFELSEEIFLDDLIGYFEGSDLASSLKTQVSSENYGTYDSFRDTFKSSTGLDFEKDFLSFLGGNYAISFHDNDGVFPGVLLIVDASANVPAAEKVVESLNNQAAEIVENLQVAYEDSGMDFSDIASRKKLVIDGGPGYLVELDLQMLFAALPNEDAEKFTLSFGLTGDDIFYVSTYRGFLEAYGRHALSENDYFDALLKEISMEDALSVSYVNFDPFTNFADRLFDFRTEVTNLIGEGYLDFYDQYGNYLNPLKSGVFSIKKQGEGVFLDGFLHFD